MTEIRNSPSGQLKTASGGGGIVPPAGQIDGTEFDPLVVGITESGNAELDIGSIPDGSFLKRVGLSIVGVAIAATVAVTAPITGDGSVGTPLAISGFDVTAAYVTGGTPNRFLKGGASNTWAEPTVSVTAPITGTGASASALALSGVDLTSLTYITSGPANTFLKGNGAGVANSWATLLTSPANPGDNGKVVIAQSGDFTYLAGTTGKALIYNGTAWAAGTDFGANTLTTTDGYVGNSGTSYLRLGLVAGSGSGVASAAATGNLRAARGTNGFIFTVRNNGDTADLNVITTDTVAGLLNISSVSAGSLSTIIFAPSAGSITMRVGSSSTQVSFSTSAISTLIPTFSFFTSVTAPLITQLLDSTNGVTGHKMTINAQNCSGTTTIGGDIDIIPGYGTTRGGLGRLMSGGSIVGTQKIAWNDTGVALFGGTPVAQPARVGQATNSTGVAAVNKTMSDVTTGGLADPAKVNLNFANLVDNMWNLLEGRLSAAGTGVGVTA